MRGMVFDEAYWREARVRLAALARLDPKCELVFASDAHRYKVLEPVSEREIAAFERQHKLKLPLEYRAFLKGFGAGGAGPDYGIYEFSDLYVGNVAERFPRTETREWPEDPDDPLWRFPGLLCVGTAGCGIDAFLEVNGAQPGTMWIDAGPGETFVRMDSFGAWYNAWLERVEAGLRGHARLAELVRSRASLPAIAGALGLEPKTVKYLGREYRVFQGIPGQLEVDGECVVKLSVGTNWLQ
jgi:hypothetical protein